MTFEQMWQDVATVGRVDGGGYRRQSFAGADLELREWFAAAAGERGLSCEVDPFGNLAAWWRPADVGTGPGMLTGSHLDSVVDGGAYDGLLGVVSGFAALDLLREGGVVPARPVGVAAFAEQEGSRFGRPSLGAGLATGALGWAEARELCDSAGVRLPDALAAAGIAPPDADPGRDAVAAAFRRRVACYVELHLEQGRDLADRDAPVGLGGRTWPHGRYRFDFTGTGDHAGTARMEDRRDPMLGYAMTVLAANKQARLSGQRATFGRVEVAPGAADAVPSRVTGWLDARAEDEEALERLVAAIVAQGTARSQRDGTELVVTPESVSPAVVLDPSLAGRVGAGRDWPVVPTAAGHGAGVLNAAGVPAAMLFVRNPTGVSHSPAEHADLADCLVGVRALADTLARLAV
ncbi:allantoate amidohydrolase [Nocardioides sp. 616]|uniref:allantoate amidohydrolase n=1 Tax=Nocardioides sp. 616 TaxID=2268090 RepID=UPI001F05CBC3|nr:allantoate amidohydrolase [Nocardioides sp. 616]